MNKNFNFKKAAAGVGMMFAITALVVPAAAFAQTPDRPAAADRGAGTNFCANIDTFIANTQSRFADSKEGLDDKYSERRESLAEKRAAKEAELRNHRNEQDAALMVRITAFADRYEGADAQSAVNVFTETVRGLVADQRTAHDSARQAFQEGIDELLSVTGGDITDLLEDRRNAIDEALTQLKADCEDGATDAEARESFREVMDTMKTQFTDMRPQAADYSDEIEALKANQAEAFAAAREAFKTGFSAAKEVLRAALAE